MGIPSLIIKLIYDSNKKLNNTADNWLFQFLMTINADKLIHKNIFFEKIIFIVLFFY